MYERIVLFLKIRFGEEKDMKCKHMVWKICHDNIIEYALSTLNVNTYSMYFIFYNKRVTIYK